MTSQTIITTQKENEIRESDRLNFEETISKPGLIEFKNYTSKLRMMDTALFLFGLKLHRMEGHVRFFDADFLNTLEVGS